MIKHHGTAFNNKPKKHTMQEEKVLIKVVLSEGEHVRARSNSFDDLPKESLISLKSVLNEFISQVDKAAEKKNITVDAPMSIINVFISSQGVNFNFDNRLIKGLPPEAARTLVKGLTNLIGIVKEKANLSSAPFKVNRKDVN